MGGHPRETNAGGVAPTASCAADSTGTTARVSYTADYFFTTQ